VTTLFPPHCRLSPPPFYFFSPQARTEDSPPTLLLFQRLYSSPFFTFLISSCTFWYCRCSFSPFSRDGFFPCAVATAFPCALPPDIDTGLRVTPLRDNQNGLDSYSGFLFFHFGFPFNAFFFPLTLVFAPPTHLVGEPSSWDGTPPLPCPSFFMTVMDSFKRRFSFSPFVTVGPAGVTTNFFFF